MRGGKHDKDKEEETLLTLTAICVLQLHVDGLLEERNYSSMESVSKRPGRRPPNLLTKQPRSTLLMHGSSGEYATIIVYRT
jgi:hypothetical protein